MARRALVGLLLLTAAMILGGLIVAVAATGGFIVMFIGWVPLAIGVVALIAAWGVARARRWGIGLAFMEGLVVAPISVFAAWLVYGVQALDPASDPGDPTFTMSFVEAVARAPLVWAAVGAAILVPIMTVALSVIVFSGTYAPRRAADGTVVAGPTWPGGVR